MKILKSILFIVLTHLGYSQSFPDLGSNQTLPEGVSSITLTADLTQLNSINNPYETTDYTVSNIPYVPQTNTGNTLLLNLGTISPMVNIGFDFCFFGQTYSQFYVSSNGWISFTPQMSLPWWPSASPLGQLPFFQPLPNNFLNNPTNCIFGVWQQWNPIATFCGRIKYQTQGTAPNRKLVVSWIEVPLQGQLYNSNNSNNNGNFHIVLYESSNIIETHIKSKPAYSSYYLSSTASQGIMNSTQSNIVLTPGRNSTVWSAFNDAHRWTPSGNEVIPTIVWYEVGNPTPIAYNTPTIDVTPSTQGTYYTCHIEYSICNKNWFLTGNPTLTPDTVFVKPFQPIEEITNNIVSNPSKNNVTEPIQPIDPPTISINSTEFETFYYVPNSFTPDGNELNNIFQPVFSDRFIPEGFHIIIFNRWGELVYESFDYTNYWDGTYNNKVCSADMYIYTVYFNNKIIKGNINLIK